MRNPGAVAAKRRATAAITDDPIFEQLRTWRAQVAKQHGVPAFVVFHDGTLRAIAQVRPRSLGELRTISGIGEKKLASYGESLLAQLATRAREMNPGEHELQYPWADVPALGTWQTLAPRRALGADAAAVCA